ncbi:MAG: hypothetical protein COT43_07615 [Candidatus Marinimicrobia bacterium CG08_land_8_20_14_0_20_45_22]|nr:MAG: hypothetical protein COT43_07615 [Candidatus Marinimicrobia bacterium CG08_land_8_20_14_0_20_45_22]
MSRKIVQSEQMPKPVGHYSHAIISNGFVFTSGQLPIVPKSGKIEASDFGGQLRQVLDNLKTVLEASGSDLSKIVKVTVFLIDLNKFTMLNQVFTEYFPKEPAARSAIQVSRLPLGSLVEIEAVATLEN